MRAVPQLGIFGVSIGPLDVYTWPLAESPADPQRGQFIGASLGRYTLAFRLTRKPS
jgi:hypothetical protein